jgi:hypothetical protein
MRRREFIVTFQNLMEKCLALFFGRTGFERIIPLISRDQFSIASAFHFVILALFLSFWSSPL